MLAALNKAPYLVEKKIKIIATMIITNFTTGIFPAMLEMPIALTDRKMNGPIEPRTPFIANAFSTLPNFSIKNAAVRLAIPKMNLVIAIVITVLFIIKTPYTSSGY